MKKIKNCIAILLSTMFILTFSNKSLFSALSMMSLDDLLDDEKDVVDVLKQDINVPKLGVDVINQENSDSGKWSAAKIAAVTGVPLVAIAGCFLFYRIYYLRRERIEIKISTLLNFNYFKNNKENNDDKNKISSSTKIN